MNDFWFKALCGATAASLLLHNPLNDTSLYHFLMLGLAGIWLCSLIIGKIQRAEVIYLAFIGVLVLNSFLSRRTFGVQPRFAADSLKLALLLAVAGFVLRFLYAKRAVILGIVGLSAVTIDCLVAFALGRYNFSYGGRLTFSDWGSPNSTSFMMAVCLLGWGCVYRRQPKMNWVRVGLVGLTVPTLYLMHLMDSRGGLLVLGVGLLARWLLASNSAQKVLIGTRGAVLILGGVAAAVIASNVDLGGRYSLNSATLDSGRFGIWQHLWLQLAESTQAQIYGFGLGSIQFKMSYLLYESAHSVFVSMLYYFGFTGLVAFSMLWFGHLLRSLRAQDPQATMRVAWTAGLTASFCVDNVVLATQVLLPFALVLGAVLSRPKTPSQSSEPEKRTDQDQVVNLRLAETPVNGAASTAVSTTHIVR